MSHESILDHHCVTISWTWDWEGCATRIAMCSQVHGRDGDLLDRFNRGSLGSLVLLKCSRKEFRKFGGRQVGAKKMRCPKCGPFDKAAHGPPLADAQAYGGSADALGCRVDQFHRSDAQIAPDIGSPKPLVCFRDMKQGICFGYLRIPVPSAFFCTLQSVPWLNAAPRSIANSAF